MKKRYGWRLLALAAATAGALGLAACGGGGDESQAVRDEPSVDAAPSESHEATGGMMMTVAAAAPADAVRALLVPGYVFPPDEGGALEVPEGGALATYAPVLRTDGGQSGYYALLSPDGEILVYDDASRAPEDGFVFIPYYVNTGGSGAMLTLGYFQLVDGALVLHNTIAVEDRAEWGGLDYLGEGQFMITALVHAADQPMADAPDAPMTIEVERQGVTIVEGDREVELVIEYFEPTADPGTEATGDIEITTDGLGPITAQSTYADVDLSGFLPDYTLTRTDRAELEAVTASMLIFEGEEGAVEVQYLQDGPLYLIASTVPSVGSALGVRLGDRMVDFWDGMECRPGLEVFVAGMICSDSGTPHLAVYFSGPRPNDVPDGWVPAADDPLAAEWMAEQVLWLDTIDMAREYQQ